MAKKGLKATSPHLLVREAGHEDYEAVMNINKEVYGGFDYLKAKYHSLLHDPNSNFYVLEVDGKVVAFRNLHLVNGGEGVLSMAARTSPDHQRHGYFRVISDASSRHVTRKYPTIKYLTFASQKTQKYSTPSEDNLKTIRVSYPLCVHSVSRKQIEDAIIMLRTYTSQANPTAASPEETRKLANDEHFCKYVIGDLPILAFEEWKPLHVTEDNMKQIGQTHISYLTRDVFTKRVTTLSYAIPNRVPSGLLYQVYIHGKSTQQVLRHVDKHLKHFLCHFSDDKPNYFEVVLPVSSNRQEYLTVMKPVFGTDMSQYPILAEEIVIGECAIEYAQKSNL